MNDPVPGAKPPRGFPGRWWSGLMVAAVLLALLATVLVVVSESARWLRLAVVAALWAALVASFALARARREAREAELRLAAAERTYQVELLREVHARREFEAALAGRVVELASAARTEELGAIEARLDELTAALAALPAAGPGDVLVHRLTVSAESTHVRSLGGWAAADGASAPTLVELAAEAVGARVLDAVPAGEARALPAAAGPAPDRAGYDPGEVVAADDPGAGIRAADEPGEVAPAADEPGAGAAAADDPGEVTAAADEPGKVAAAADDPGAGAAIFAPDASYTDPAPTDRQRSGAGPGTEADQVSAEKSGAAIPVAELLAAFGEPAPGAPRRHRRAAD